MAIHLHRIDVDLDAKQLTLHIQFSAAAPIEARRIGYEWFGKEQLPLLFSGVAPNEERRLMGAEWFGKGFRLCPADDLFWQLQALATRDQLPLGAYMSELCFHAVHAVRASPALVYPISMTGTLLKRSPKQPWWTNFKSKFALRWPFGSGPHTPSPDNPIL